MGRGKGETTGGVLWRDSVSGGGAFLLTFSYLSRVKTLRSKTPVVSVTAPPNGLRP